MKHSYRLLALTLLLTISATLVSAIPDRRDSFSIDVPFEFQVGKQVFEAGKYQIFRSGTMKIVIENRETGKQRFYLGNFDGNYNSKDTRYMLSFNKYGDTHFLRKITARGAKFDLPKTRAEKKQGKKTKRSKVTLGS